MTTQELVNEVSTKHNDQAYWAGVKTAEGMVQFYKFCGNLSVDTLNMLLDEVCSCKANSRAERDYLSGMMYELEDELKDIKRGGR